MSICGLEFLRLCPCLVDVEIVDAKCVPGCLAREISSSVLPHVYVARRHHVHLWGYVISGFGC